MSTNTKTKTPQVPNGLHEATIEHAFIATTPSGVDNLALKLEIQSEVHKGKTIWKNMFFNSPRARKQLAKELNSINVFVKNRRDLDEKLETFIGARIAINVREGTAYLMGLSEEDEAQTNDEAEDWWIIDEPEDL